MSSSVSSAETAPSQNGIHQDAHVDDRQRENANGEAHVPASSRQTPQHARCDRCTKMIEDIRYKCQQCPNFDYCPPCARLASSIHPGHDFLPLKGRIPLSEEELLRQAQSTNEETLSPTAFRLIGKETSMPAKLCPSCQPVTMPLPALNIILQDEDVRRQNKKGIQLRWPARISRLVEAAVGGCAFCSLVLYKFFGPGNSFTFMYDPGVPWVRQSESSRRKSVIEHAMSLLKLMKSDAFLFAVEPISSKGMGNSDFHRLKIELVEAKQGKEVLERALASRGQQYFEVDVYAAQGNPAAELISSRPPNPAPGAAAGLETARSWLEQCEKEHGEACAAQQSPLPSRLIDVSDHAKLRLVETSKDATGRYVAVSYCWGEAQQLQTTRTSLCDRLTGFAAGDLPQTLQDAITVTQALGIKYLWIDSVCIVQDDPADRAHEIKGMANIYKHATLTLSASKSKSASNGFLRDDADEETGLWKNLVPLAFPLPNPDAKSINKAFELPRDVFGTVWLCDEDPGMVSTFRSPVDRRAWCLQERLLSTRLLSYGRWPTFRCAQATWSDGGFYPPNPKKDQHERQLTKCLDQQRRRRTRRNDPNADAPAPSTDIHTSAQLLQSWYKLLNEYTQRELGVQADRLPAIGGVAAEIALATGFTYLAGLWQANMLHDLMWFSQAKEWLTRPAGYAGPSWSWASVESPVNYDAITADSLALARVLGCEVFDDDDDDDDNSPSGEVSRGGGGRVEIEGPFRAQVARADVLALLRDQGISDPPPRSNDVQEWYRQIMEHISNQPKARGDAGADETKASWEDRLPDELAAVVTFSRDWRVKHEQRIEGVVYSGLLLRRVEREGEGEGEGECYERIGAFVNETRPWLDLTREPWERTRVVLV